MSSQKETPRSKPAKLSDLIFSLEMDSEEHAVYFDRETGQIVSIESQILSSVEENDEEGLADLADWQEAELDIARAVVEDDGTRFIPGPDKFDFNEYRHMERFIHSQDDAKVAGELWRAIKGPGAFRYFKDTLHRHGIQDQWYKYRDGAMKRFVIEWAEANNVPYKDDTR